MDTLLPEIEKPRGLNMKLAYHFSRRQFGKSAHTAESRNRTNASGLRSVLREDRQTRQRTNNAAGNSAADSRTSGAHQRLPFLHARSFTIKASMNQAKFDALEQYYTSHLFSEAERAVLDYVTDLTRERESQHRHFRPYGAPFHRNSKSARLSGR